MSNSNIKVLLVEDDEVEKMKFQRAVSSLSMNLKVTTNSNGEEALEYLKNEENSLPDIILLDLNMPRVHGTEFLATLKKDEDLRYIPVVILTTSNHKKDIKSCYKNGIAGYIIKPLRYEDYVSKIDNIFSYWSYNELISS
ncbi:CheY-like chemotaxis protein [Lutibacter sp. Hel_I_33_5]|uniref:response regulator n=1 Tax=Lutibacter sp. Hel_I_33_5 TaxID=1566289 RepID=UPI00119FDF85|nr:response regulator [Lutibacter sp. Hel_I_33_5]TVZ55864.1 CheY-like chemotaxis protein [Lutibacter sp. Hel_I_33_5]